MEPRNKRRHWLINLSESCHRIVGFVFPAMLVASLTNHAKSDQRSTSFRRPELVAIAWHNDFTSRKLQAWRADGDLLDEEETSWIANDVRRIQRRQASNFGRDLHQLVLVFRIDESAVSSQVIRCRVRQEGRPHAFGSGSPSTRNHLAKSSLTTAKNRLPKWPPHLDIEALVPDGEPEVIHKLDGPPDRPIKLASGIEWSVGLRRRAFLGLKGDPEEDVSCCLLRTDSTLSPPLDEFQFEIKLRDGTWVPWRSARTINESPDVQWTVSDPLDEANPITSITITRLRRRLEIYEKVPIRLDIEPRDPAVPVNFLNRMNAR